MDKIEMINRAKSYIEKLANGINPLTDLPLNEDDAVNDVRLSRCLFFVADVLRQVIENGGSVTKPRKARTAFYISDEDIARFEYSDSPITITEITNRINVLIDSGQMKGLYYEKIKTWLLMDGMMEKANGRFGKAKICPTEAGSSIGISMHMRMGKKGEIWYPIYDRSAQEYVVRNIGKILELASKK